MSRTTQAMVLTGHGGLDRLESREDWPRPEPGPRQAPVRAGGRGLNDTNENTRAGLRRQAEATTTEADAAAAPDAADASWGGPPIRFPRIQDASASGEAKHAGVATHGGDRAPSDLLAVSACAAVTAPADIVGGPGWAGLVEPRCPIPEAAGLDRRRAAGHRQLQIQVTADWAGDIERIQSRFPMLRRGEKAMADHNQDWRVDDAARVGGAARDLDHILEQLHRRCTRAHHARRVAEQPMTLDACVDGMAAAQRIDAGRDAEIATAAPAHCAASTQLVFLRDAADLHAYKTCASCGAARRETPPVHAGGARAGADAGPRRHGRAGVRHRGGGARRR